VNHFKIKKLVKNIFKNFNLSNSHAKISAEYLIKAELVGAPSHGLARLKMYCERINKKLINPKPKFKIKKISQSITHIDANNSIGFVAGDIGIKVAIKNAKKLGVKKIIIEDLKDIFVKEYVYPMIRGHALYEGVYLLGTSIARPLIAKDQIRVAKKFKAYAVSHGSTGKGNDQVRFELGYHYFGPKIKIIAPWRIWKLKSRTDMLDKLSQRISELRMLEQHCHPRIIQISSSIESLKQRIILMRENYSGSEQTSVASELSFLNKKKSSLNSERSQILKELSETEAGISVIEDRSRLRKKALLDEQISITGEKTELESNITKSQVEKDTSEKNLIELRGKEQELIN